MKQLDDFKAKKTLSAENENRRVILTLMKEKEQMKKLTVTFPDSLALAARLRYHLSSGLGFESLPMSSGFAGSMQIRRISSLFMEWAIECFILCKNICLHPVL